jgi:hypothetical protein
MRVFSNCTFFDNSIELFQKINAPDLSNFQPFQTWIYLDSEYPTCDALYLHTSNPHSSFPFVNQDIVWLSEDKEIPEILKGIVSLIEFEVGEYRHFDGKPDYFIRIVNLGMSFKDSLNSKGER